MLRCSTEPNPDDFNMDTACGFNDYMDERERWVRFHGRRSCVGEPDPRDYNLDTICGHNDYLDAVDAWIRANRR